MSSYNIILLSVAHWKTWFISTWKFAVSAVDDTHSNTSIVCKGCYRAMIAVSVYVIKRMKNTSGACTVPWGTELITAAARDFTLFTIGFC